MTRGIEFLFVIFGFFAFWPIAGVQAAIQQSSVELSAEQFALEGAPKARLDMNILWESPGKLPAPRFSVAELKIFAFQQVGQEGDKSFDVNTAVVRLEDRGVRHFWLGRALPLKEDPSRLEMPSTGALGVNWVQNQSNSLEPRPSGWIGAGWAGNVLDLGVSVIVSPIFLPNFGPRLTLSEKAEASGSRFAQLPPAYLRGSDGSLIPMRYRLDTGDLQNVILRNQFFISIGPDTSWGSLRFLAWGAPSPQPVIDTQAGIAVDGGQKDVTALVTVVPKFPFQRFYGMHLVVGPTQWESAYEDGTGLLTLSGEAHPLHWLTVGALQRVALKEQPADTNVIVAASPYAKDLIWGEVGTWFFGGTLKPSLRLEHHFTSGKEGSWVRPLVQYAPKEGLIVYAQASILTGQEGSYFGQWRSLDSVSTGVRYQW